MLDRTDHPVSWVLWMYELEDAHEHLGELIQELVDHGSIDEDDFRVQLGHVFAHLNRAWHGRDEADEEEGSPISLDTRRTRSAFPTDLEPVG